MYKCYYKLIYLCICLHMYVYIYKYVVYLSLYSKQKPAN
jgi:hypothetical protein